jgi:hypothetical protein
MAERKSDKLPFVSVLYRAVTFIENNDLARYLSFVVRVYPLSSLTWVRDKVRVE